MRKLAVTVMVAAALTAGPAAQSPAPALAPTAAQQAAAIKAGLKPADIRSWMTDPDVMADPLKDADMDALVAYLVSLKTVKK